MSDAARAKAGEKELTDARLVEELKESPWERAMREAALENAFHAATVGAGDR